MVDHFPFCSYTYVGIKNIKFIDSNAKYFSTLDAISGFWMIKLDEYSSRLCTFATLEKVLERARQVNLKFNADKCNFLMPEIKYLGHTFSSNGMSPDQKKIEKELYAIQFGCNRFRQYVLGHKVKVETDHKPLVVLFNKPLSEVPPRLQRMMLNLQQYDLEVSYIPGKFLYIADTLSRAPVEPSDPDDRLEEELLIHMNLLITNLAV
ncbi:RNase H-like domain found in reverse transcriptase [Popillia japonica]|uniref:RNase H-like domain found in reverse transcriptase n=1 Tax=Popillia japonica TaxID=7064 RepID=A0AAW1K5C5_POPJA